jgi:hypothetical protein
MSYDAIDGCLSPSGTLLHIYQNDLSGAATELPADLQTHLDEWQTYRNYAAAKQNETDSYCAMAWIYKQWKDGII